MLLEHGNAMRPQRDMVVSRMIPRPSVDLLALAVDGLYCPPVFDDSYPFGRPLPQTNIPPADSDQKYEFNL